MENRLEARLWNKIFVWTQQKVCTPVFSFCPSINHPSIYLQLLIWNQDSGSTVSPEIPRLLGSQSAPPAHPVRLVGHIHNTFGSPWELVTQLLNLSWRMPLPSHPTEQTHFVCLYPWSHSFAHHPKLVTRGDGGNVDWPVNTELLLSTQLLLHLHGLGQWMHHCRRSIFPPLVNKTSGTWTSPPEEFQSLHARRDARRCFALSKLVILGFTDRKPKGTLTT